MEEKVYQFINKLFMYIGNIHIYSSDSFHTSQGNSYVRCVHKSESGLLYFMENSMFFIHKPTIQIAFDVMISWMYYE